MSETAAFSDHFRRCLEECDIATIRKLWAHVAPGMPPLSTDYNVLSMIHHARTQAESIALDKRAWSHRWLLDHNLPSGLPDALRPRAERIYPRVTSAVGISVNFRSEDMAPLAAELQRAMSTAVEDAYAGHQTEPAFIKARMAEARAKVLKR